MADAFLLDTSALMALLEKEPGGERVEQLLAAAHRGEIRLVAAFASRMELVYLVEQEQGAEALGKLKALLPLWPLIWMHSDDALCDSAASFKAKHRLSFADAFVAAAAAREDATLVHKDPQFSALGTLVKQEVLPLKTATASSS
jgi:predicted nucleic acid-binding protein